MKIRAIITALVTTALLGGCVHQLAQQAGLETAKALGIGVTDEWYTSTVNDDATIGTNGIRRHYAYELCERQGMELVNFYSTQYERGPVNFSNPGTFSMMNQHAKQARAVTDTCMIRYGFQRTRQW